MGRRDTSGPRPRASRARARPSYRHPGDAQARACTQARGRVPVRSVREWRRQRQASSGAQRRCRRPGGASLSLKTHGGKAATTSPARAGFTEGNPADAAHGAPTKRKVRKLDSLSAATEGPTTSILRFVLQCVNGGADRVLESGVETAGTTARSSQRAFTGKSTRPCSAAQDTTKTARSAHGDSRRTPQNRSHGPEYDTKVSGLAINENSRASASHVTSIQECVSSAVSCGRRTSRPGVAQRAAVDEAERLQAKRRGQYVRDGSGGDASGSATGRAHRRAAL